MPSEDSAQPVPLWNTAQWARSSVARRERKVLDRYARWIRERHLERQPLRVLKQHGGGGAKWSSLESGGIWHIAALNKRLAEIESLPGVGAVTVARLQQALADYLSTLEIDVGFARDSEEYQRALHASVVLDRLDELWLARAQELTQSIRQEANSLPGVLRTMTWSRPRIDASIEPAASRIRALLERLETLAREIRELPEACAKVDGYEVERGHVERIGRLTQMRLHLGGYIAANGEPRSELELEDRVLVPLLQRAGLAFERQVPVALKQGSNTTTGFADIVVRSSPGGAPRSVIESKYSVPNPQAADDAAEQARSYALALRIRRIAVASSEGIRILDAGVEEDTELVWIPRADVEARLDELATLLMGRGDETP